MWGGHKHNVAAAETEEWEPAGVSHSTVCAELRRKDKNLFRNPHLLLKLAVRGLCELCAWLTKQGCVEQVSHGPEDTSSSP